MWNNRKIYVGFQADLLSEDEADIAAKFSRFTDLTGVPLKPISPDQDVASLCHTGLDAIYLAYTV